jgi:hypothetical protein
MPLSPSKSRECIRLAKYPRTNTTETALESLHESLFGAPQTLDVTGQHIQDTNGFEIAVECVVEIRTFGFCHRIPSLSFSLVESIAIQEGQFACHDCGGIGR